MINYSMDCKTQTLKGFRDFLPPQMAVRNYVKNLLIQVFENYGFQPLETPALEYSSTLMGKYGDEADKLVYSFKDNGDRLIGLRYDLTVPTAKVLSIYQNQITFPFKRYQIQPVYRAENTQKGRYREVLQCDIDIFGKASPVNDAEIISIIYTILTKLNFKKYKININSRSILSTILSQSKVTDNKNSVLQSLDKYQKIGQDGVIKELKDKGLSTSQINSIFNCIKTAKPDDYLKSVFEYLDLFQVPKSAYNFDPTLARGLDYYTGPIFETYVQEPKIGSITGGGRYDNLTSLLGGPQVSAVGTTIGLDRIVDCIIELNLLPNISSNSTKIMIANFPNSQTQSFTLLNTFRQQNISSIIYPDSEKLGKQFKYADSLKIPFVAIIGEDEIKQNKITLRDMTTGDQKLLTSDQIIKYLL